MNDVFYLDQYECIISDYSLIQMSGVYDRIFAFTNGMVAGTLLHSQDGHKSSSCNLSKSLKLDFKLNPKKPLNTQALQIVLTKLSKIKVLLLSIRVKQSLFRNCDSLDRCRHIRVYQIWPIRKLQVHFGNLERIAWSSCCIDIRRQDSGCIYCWNIFISFGGMIPFILVSSRAYQNQSSNSERTS